MRREAGDPYSELRAAPVAVRRAPYRWRSVTQVEIILTSRATSCLNVVFGAASGTSCGTGLFGSIHDRPGSVSTGAVWRARGPQPGRLLPAAKGRNDVAQEYAPHAAQCRGARGGCEPAPDRAEPRAGDRR